MKDFKKQIDFTKELSKEGEKKGNIKTVGDAVGMPDAVDKERIRKYLLKYENEHPGEIKMHRDMARARIEAAGKDKKFAVMDKDSSRRYMMELPVEIGMWLEATYPLMFREKKHYQWFFKNFSELLIGEKY